MMIKKIKWNRSIAIAGFVLLVSACAGHNSVFLDSENHHKNIDQTIEELTVIEPAGGAISLSLEEAVLKALRDNLDARVAAYEAIIAQDNITLEQMAMLPNVSASGTYTRRSDDAASSSESIITGTQSLEPSTSSDQQRQLANLEVQWNLIDMVIASVSTQNAKDRHVIALERLRTVQHNLERDVADAYWNALIKQEAYDELIDIQKIAISFQHNIAKAQDQKLLSLVQANQKSMPLLDQLEKMLQLKEVMVTADIELKGLLTIPQAQPVFLTSEPHNAIIANDYGDKPVEELIRVALVKRPEMREQYANQNIAIGDKRAEVLRTFPGLNLIYTRDYDSNGFLVHESWNNFSAALTQSLNAILTYSTRIDRATAQIEMEEARRMALAAAIIAQVSLNKMRLDMAKKQYDLASLKYKQKQELSSLTYQKAQLGSSSVYEARLHQMDVIEAKILRDRAFANVHRAHMDMNYALGVSGRNGQYAEVNI